MEHRDRAEQPEAATAATGKSPAPPHGLEGRPVLLGHLILHSAMLRPRH